MRMLMIIEIPAEGPKESLRSGKGFEVFPTVLSQINPEAVYFAPRNGNRGAYIVFDLDDVSRIPAISEPFFLSFNAKVELVPCFTPAELEKATPDIQSAVEQYA